jgi:D-inositol-3-phosphate glycosyltransferase
MTTANPYSGKLSLRIAMLSIHSSPIGPLGTRDTGGMSVYVREVSRWLGRMGHRIDIFTCAGGEYPQAALYPNVRLIHLAGALPADPSKARLPACLPGVFEAMDAYRKTHRVSYDLIHSHYWISGVVGALAQMRWRRPHLTMFHTLGAVKNSTCSGENESALRIAHERWLAMAADHVVVPAPREMQNLLDFYHARQSKISVIPCGVNLDLFRPMDGAAARKRLGLSVDADVVLYVGRFAPLKGVERLLGAMALLRPRFPRLQLMIVGGDGPSAQSHQALAALADRLGIQDIVRFMGRVEQKALPPYYNAADVLALPSHYESFGLVVLEALACGTPVAATHVGAVERIVRENMNGAIVDGRQAEDVAVAIGRVLGKPRSRRLSATQIRATVNGYGWPRIAAAVEAAYEALLEIRDPAESAAVAAPCGGLYN